MPPFRLRLQLRRTFTLVALVCGLVLFASISYAAPAFAPVPAEIRSTHFLVAVNGRSTPVLHAASGYYLLNFDLSGPAEVRVTAPDAHYWDRGVEIQPLRLGIRPQRMGATLRFRLNGPAKVSISRPGDHFADAEMLFLFANSPESRSINAETPGIRYFGPGAHHENIDAHSGESIYLADGAVIFGALNLWQVHDVHVFGRGTIVYDGPQNPKTDEGWMHRPNWHCIVMDQASNLEIDGITCVVRSRTWQIQMRDSHHIGFYNIKVIGGNPNDANQDGMDWLGGGDTTVRDSFFRASDDVFALQGNWEGYSEEAIRTPGHDVNNVTVEDTVVSTSVSNIMRVGWPEKTFNSAHVHLRNLDVLHTGFGACKVPFAFFELWADPEGHGRHSDYSFENIRLEDWYSLFQIRQPDPEIRDLQFSNIAALDGPGMLPSTLKGDVSGVSLLGVPFNPEELRVEGTAAPSVTPEDIGFAYDTGLLRPHRAITFRATAQPQPGQRFSWTFGDGTAAEGAIVRHAFPDDAGTYLDGSGRFLVVLHTTQASGAASWRAQPVVIAERSHPAFHEATPQEAAGQSAIESQIDVPVEGGYTFTLLSAQPATVQIDDLPAVATPKMRLQVCGSTGYAVQSVRISAALEEGPHRVRVVTQTNAPVADALSGAAGPPRLSMQGPGLNATLIPLSPRP